jgi:hypothetical protein
MNVLEQLGASGDARVDAAAHLQDGRYLWHEEHLMREAISGHQRSSVVIRGHHALASPRREMRTQSVVISGHQWSSAPITHLPALGAKCGRERPQR